MPRITKFLVTNDHIKLLRRAYVSWEDCEFGAPAIDCKRPYGNSAALTDIAEILSVPREKDSDGDYEELSEDVKRMCHGIHRETQIALQIFLDTGEMKPGKYELPEGRYSKGWRRCD